MVVGAVRSRIEPDVPQWDAVVGERFIAAVAAPARDRVLTALAEAASVDGLELEDLVARIPIGPHGADDFALVWWPETGDPVTAIVRGDAVIDLASPGGARRFDSRGISPWHLAEFTAVTRLRIAGPHAPLDAVRQAGLRGEAVPSRRASFRAGAVEWSWRELPSGAESADPDVDTVLEARRPPTGGARPGARATRSDGDGPTTVPIQVVVGDTVRFVRGDAADADTVLSPRLLRGGDGGDADDAGRSDAAAADSDRDALEAAQRADQAAPTLARFRIGGGEPRTIDAPAYIGRNPAPPRVAPGPISLVRVDSPGGVVSSTHLELRVEGSRVVATDLRSTNGTVVRSTAGVRRLRPGESVVVSPGTTLELGGEALVEILASREVADSVAAAGRGEVP